MPHTYPEVSVSQVSRPCFVGEENADHCNAHNSPKWQVARGKAAVVTVAEESPIKRQKSAQGRRQIDLQTSVPRTMPTKCPEQNPAVIDVGLVRKTSTSQKRVGRVRALGVKQAKKPSSCVVRLHVAHDPPRCAEAL